MNISKCQIYANIQAAFESWLVIYFCLCIYLYGITTYHIQIHTYAYINRHALIHMYI